jgi:hypothetical protein
MFAYRLWQARRVVVTKDVISFALIGDDNEIDFVPLADVGSVEEMHGMDDLESNQVPRRLRDLKLMQSSMNAVNFSGSGILDGNAEPRAENTSQLFVNAFQIATIPNGYNSGRSYYLQAESSDLEHQVMTQLRTLATIARKKAEARSSFRKSQDRARAIYTAKPFQIGASLLIVAVNYFPAHILVAQCCSLESIYSSHTHEACLLSVYEMKPSPFLNSHLYLCKLDSTVFTREFVS